MEFNDRRPMSRASKSRMAPKAKAAPTSSWSDDIPTTGTVHLPPTPEALEHMKSMVQQHQEHRAGEMLEQVEHLDNQKLARGSAYGMGGHKALSAHLENEHGAWPEDITKDDAARWHRSWHNDSDWDHDHG